jgi:hypothetical protein
MNREVRKSVGGNKKSEIKNQKSKIKKKAPPAVAGKPLPVAYTNPITYTFNQQLYTFTLFD